MIIYKITNNVNGKFYIGKTIKSAEERFQKHRYSHQNQNTHLYNSMRKHGFENFSIEVIEEVENDINERECYWIKHLNPHYNMTSGGDGGDTSRFREYKSLSEETKQKVSDSKKGTTPWNKGQKTGVGGNCSQRSNSTKKRLRENAKVGVVDIHGNSFSVSVSEYKSRDDLFHNRSKEGQRLIRAKSFACS